MNFEPSPTASPSPSFMISGTVVAPSSNLQLSPSSRVTIDNVSWDDYELLLLEIGDRSCDRMMLKNELENLGDRNLT